MPIKLTHDIAHVALLQQHGRPAGEEKCREGEAQAAVFEGWRGARVPRQERKAARKGERPGERGEQAARDTIC